MRRLRNSVLKAALVMAPLSLFAQAPQIKLKPADAILGEEFTAIGSVRELSDGRVLLNDSRDKRVVVADFKAGTVTQVGRVGSGPNEYGTAGPLHRLAGDTTALFDNATRRWLLFSGASIVATLAADAPIIAAMKGLPRGADARGNVWQVASPALAGLVANKAQSGTLNTGPGDSDIVIRVNRATLQFDTLAKIRMAPTRMTIRASADGKVTGMNLIRPPMAVGEESIMFPDGWFAIARLDPYRVDWINPDGKLVKGAPIPVPLVKMTDAEKDAFFDRADAGKPASAQKPTEAVRAERRADLPQFIPPYQAPALLAANDGSVILHRYESKDSPNARYDVVNRKSQLIGVLSLGAKERIIGFGAKSVYVAWKDDDDIERLRRNPWP